MDGRFIGVMRIVYVDDSGSGGDSPYFVLAGYSAAMEDWLLFTEAWQRVLDSHPRIAYFKMREAESLRDEFAGFSVPVRDKKLSKLISVIEQFKLFETSVFVPSSIFNSIVTANMPIEVRNPYLLAFVCMVGLTPFLDQIMGVESKVDFVFDSDERNELTGRGYFKTLMRKIPQVNNALGEIDYRDDKQFNPLQAADLIAWQNRRFFSFPKEPRRNELGRLHSRRDMWFRKLLNREDIEEMLPWLVVASDYIKANEGNQQNETTS